MNQSLTRMEVRVQAGLHRNGRMLEFVASGGEEGVAGIRGFCVFLDGVQVLGGELLASVDRTILSGGLERVRQREGTYVLGGATVVVHACNLRNRG